MKAFLAGFSVLPVFLLAWLSIFRACEPPPAADLEATAQVRVAADEPECVVAGYLNAEPFIFHELSCPAAHRTADLMMQEPGFSHLYVAVIARTVKRTDPVTDTCHIPPC